MQKNPKREYLESFGVPALAFALIAALIIGIGTTLINFYEGGEKDRLDRPELWFAIGVLVVVMLVASLLSRQPDGTGALGKDVMIGKQSIWGDTLPPVDVDARLGERGTTSDISEGFTVYAQNGALATVLGVLPAGIDYGRKYSGIIYGSGLMSASKELWIPFEAVSAVYPESRSVFLAAKGDETETLGWTNPPEGMVRGQSKHTPASDKVK